MTTLAEAHRLPMLDRTADAIIAAAKARGAHPCPVVNRQGRIDEVHLYRGGKLVASVFNAGPGAGLGVWIDAPRQPQLKPASTPEEAVLVALGLPAVAPDGPRKVRFRAPDLPSDINSLQTLKIASFA